MAGQHGADDPRIPKIRQAFIGFHRKILTHLRGEAEVLFLLLRQLESNLDEVPVPFSRGWKLSLERIWNRSMKKWKKRPRNCVP